MYIAICVCIYTFDEKGKYKYKFINCVYFQVILQKAHTTLLIRKNNVSLNFALTTN